MGHYFDQRPVTTGFSPVGSEDRRMYPLGRTTDKYRSLGDRMQIAINQGVDMDLSATVAYDEDGSDAIDYAVEFHMDSFDIAEALGRNDVDPVSAPPTPSGDGDPALQV